MYPAYKPLKAEFVICIYSIMFIFCYFTDHYVEQNVCFYSFRSSHREISYKIGLQFY